jgi:hypothetical protein|tara:strand:- start:1918 stop:2436 length:519 start_codon:yes stop_codon:yes gene_type:complete
MGKDTQRVLYTKTKVSDRVTFCALQGKNPLTLFSPFSVAVNCLNWAICPHKKSRPIHEADLVMTKKEIIKRQKEIKVRLTEAEHQALLERMTGGELATWIRNTCLDEKPNKKRNYKAADPQLLAALGRIGGNLNQIARQVNTVESDIEKIRAFAELAIIREQLQGILADYDR